MRKLISGAAASVVMIASMLIGQALMAACAVFQRSGNGSDTGSWDASDFNMLEIDRVEQTSLPAALEWREDAFLTEIDIDVWPDGTDLDPIAFAGFNSTGDPEIWFLVQIEARPNGEYVVADTASGEFNDPRPLAEAVDTVLLRRGAREALQIALTHERGAGREVIRQAEWPGTIKLSRLDDYNFSGPVVWSISIGSIASGVTQHVVISDDSGDVVDVRTTGN